MKFKAALFYNGNIVFYSIFLLRDNLFKAKLDDHNGVAQPPSLVELRKENYGWKTDCVDSEIVNELTAAIDYKSVGRKQLQ